MRPRAVRETSAVRLQLARTLWRRGTLDLRLRVGLSPKMVSAVKLKAVEMVAIEKTSLPEPFKDQTRGENYQICPLCENPLTHRKRV